MTKLLTRRQYDEGWKELRLDLIPNVRARRYVLEMYDGDHVVVRCHHDGSPMDGGPL